MSNIRAGLIEIGIDQGRTEERQKSELRMNAMVDNLRKLGVSEDVLKKATDMSQNPPSKAE